MGITDSLAGRAATELQDHGLGPNGTFVRYRGLDGTLVAGISNDGYFYGKGINGLNYAITKITLSSAQILTLHSAPIIIVPAAGPNTCNVLQELILHYKFGTAAYVTGSQNIGTYYDALPAVPISLTNCLGFLTATSNQMNNPVIQSNLTVPDANCVNQPIFVYTTTSDPTTGDGTLDIYLKYFTFNF